LLPPALIRSLKGIKGFDEEAFAALHRSGEQVTSIRLNPGKTINDPYSIFNAPLEKVPWTSHGYYLPVRPSFTLDPLFHAGAYYVQEASSMFLEEVLKQTVDLSKSLKILDLCAAPGGKSTLIQSVISKESLLVSNELIKTRVDVLQENITKWGGTNVIVTNNDPGDFQRLENYFDVIIVDAPCSGSGLFRKDPAAIEEWSENNVALCSQRQQRILANVIPALKEGGFLIYSTCSYSKEEDESICDWSIKELNVESLRLKLEKSWSIIETESEKFKAYGYRFYPDKLKGEGFFIAAFRKKELETGSRQSRERKQKINLDKLPVAVINIVRPYLKNAADFFFIKQRDEVLAIPLHLENDLSIIQSALYIKKAGVKLGTIIRNELIPDHELALSTNIDLSIERIDADLIMALQYLRREEIKPETVGTGWFLLAHQQLPLGWMKILSNRVNNYYPKASRILNKR
jgi:16S rRNA C967 or C1407 C5-methylase (RsmB/RsmF family)/NOL1/NOP2/fmu family ribosome biogenesis protein